ncbi:MAG: TonB-dependent receptor [Woeseiaceae bacterium]|nr:TonB-dependent receptor [Woeseiaceae bacterium]
MSIRSLRARVTGLPASIPNKPNLFSSRLLALALCAAISLPESANAQSVDAEAELQLEEVVVTGSRVKRNDTSSISPITVLSDADLAVSGNLTLENFIQDMPAVNGGDFGAGVNNGNPGIASVSLRGLGPNRTLVLVNSKRYASAAVNGYVDLNMIPTAIVERVEVLRDGASTVYGSDAIAGVVNVITKKDFEGVDIQLGYDITDESDGEMINGALVFGSTFDRGNFIVAAQVNKREEIRQGDRAFSACPFFDDGSAVSCGGSPTTTPAQFTPRGVDSAIGGHVLDADGVTVRPFDDARDSFNYAALSYLTTPQDVYSAYAAANYELLEAPVLGPINANLEMNFSNRVSDQLLAPVGTFGGWITSQEHPDNPFGDALCASNPLCTEPQDVATSRRLTESGGRRFTQDVNAWRIGTGFDGQFENGWTWDINYTLAAWEDSQRDEGRPNRPNIEAMMDPTLCAAATNGCPGIFNPFISDSMTEAQVAYGFVGVNTKAESTLNVLQLNFSGDMGGIDLPGGEIGWAFGYENRREEAASKPDGGAAIGAIAFTAGEVTSGKYEVDEFYGEVVLPILSDAPMAELLTLEASARWTDVDFLDDSDTVFKVAVEWAPIEDVRLRGTFSEGFRAPNISELFLGIQQSAETYTDPCRNYGTSGTDATTVANCQADGLAPDFNLATFQATTLEGGNPDLQPETSESLTVGLVLTPSFVDGLSVSIDYFDVEITDAVGSAPTSEVISACYASPGFSDPLCALIVGPEFPGVDELPSPGAPTRRNSNLQISGILQSSANLATYETSGIDFQIDYGFETGIGLVDLRASGTYLSEYDYLPFAGGELIQLAGFFGGDPAWGNPATFAEWQVNYGVTLTRDDWGANLTARYMSETDDIAAAPANLQNVADAITYLDIQGYYNWNDVTFTLGVRNLTDEDPPYVTAYDDMNTLQFSYDTQGRYIYGRASISF